MNLDLGVARRARLGVGVLLAGLALASLPVSAQTADPWEGMNRGIFRFNDWTDARILRPTAVAYQTHVPGPIRQGVGNVFDNVGTPAVAVNQLLQGKPVRALSDGARFLLNTTVGLGGIFDVASGAGLKKHTEDFGQTFGRWGVGSGYYVVLPVMGSSNVRDAVGRVFDSFANPLRLLSPDTTRAGVVALSVVDLRADLLGVDELVVGDRYVFFRDAYEQRRTYLINDGVIESDGFDDDGFDDGADF